MFRWNIYLRSFELKSEGGNKMDRFEIKSSFIEFDLFIYNVHSSHIQMEIYFFYFIYLFTFLMNEFSFKIMFVVSLVFPLFGFLAKISNVCTKLCLWFVFVWTSQKRYRIFFHSFGSVNKYAISWEKQWIEKNVVYTLHVNICGYLVFEKHISWIFLQTDSREFICCE